MNKIVNIYDKYKEIIYYLIFGVLTTVVSLIVYYFFTLVFLNPNDPILLQVANILSWIAGVLFAYFTNRRYVFKSKGSKKKEVSKFILARLITLGMDMLIMFVGVTILSGNDKFIKILSQFFVVVSNYLFSKILVFRKE